MTTTPKTILLVEDEAILATIAALTLKKFGYEVLLANTGEKGVRIALEKPVDLVLMDIDLGKGIDGPEATRQILEKRNIPIVFLTSHSEKEYVDRVKKITRYGYVIKNSGDFVLQSSIEMAFELFEAHEKLESELSERRRAEEETKTILRTAMDGSYLVDTEGRILDTNDSYCRMIGYGRDELLAMSVKDIEAIDTQEVIEQRIQQIVKTGYVRFETKHKCKDGKVIDIEASVNSLKDDSGKVFCFMRDITERKRTEEQREFEQQEKDALINSTKDLIWSVSKDLTLMAGNRPFIKSVMEFSGKTLMRGDLILSGEIFPPELIIVWKKIYDIALSGKSYSDEFFTPATENSKSSWLELTINPIWDNNQVVGIACFGKDITERKKIAEELKKSEAKYRGMFESVQDIYYETTIEGMVLEISPSIEAASKGQLQRSDLIGASIHDYYLAPGGRNALLELLQKQGTLSDYEVILKNRDGSHVPCSISAKIQFDAQGMPAKILGSVRDITERKKVTDALLKSEQKFREIFNNVNDAIYLIEFIEDGAIGRFKEVNIVACKMLGYTREEFLKMSPVNINANDITKQIDKMVAPLLEVGKSITKTVHRTKDGRDVPVEISSQIVEMMGETMILSIARDITERERTEESLHKTKSTLQAALDQSPAGIAIADAPGGYLRYVNNAGLMIRGGDRQAIVDGVGINQYVSSWQLLDLDGQPLGTEDVPLARAVMFGEVNSREFIVRRESNDDRIVLANAAPIRNDKEEVIAGIVVFTDITERKKEEQTLRESEERYRKLITTMQDGVYRSSHNGKFLEVNPAMVKILGYDSEDELLAIDIKKQLYFAVEDRESAALEETLEEMAVFRLKKKDGSEVWVEDHGRHVVDESGNILYHEGVLRDVTERKRMEDSLRKSDQEFRSLAESMPQIVWITRPDGWNIYFNQQWVEYTGQTLEESYGDGWNKPFHPDDQKRAWDAWQNATKKGGIYSTECRLRRADGVYKWWLIRGVALQNANGEILKWFGTCTDIDNIKAMLQEKELMLKEVHHRIKNNMNSVAGLISLQADILKDPAAIAVLKDVESRVQTMKVLYNKLYEAESFRDLPISEYLFALVDEIVANFPNSGIVKIEKFIDHFVLDVKTMHPLGIIINELLTNSMKHAFVGRDKGLIAVSATVENKHAVIVIQDDGVGIPPSVDIGSSTGFGLQLVDMLTQQIGGMIRIERGNGTRFVLEFEA